MKQVLAGVVLLALAGCSSAQLAAAEADIRAALINADAIVIAAAADPVLVNAALDAAGNLDPGNATLQTAVTKGKAAVARGDLATAHLYLSAGAALMTPAQSP